MELRVLQYFLAVAREQSITGAAASLHLSQPTLSRQIRDLENELGTQLLIRGDRKVTLTNDGILLRKRAEEIMELVRRTENEIGLSDEQITGDISIASGETDGVRFLARAISELQAEYPGIHFHISSGDRSNVLEELEHGLIDFGLIFGDVDTARYDYLKVPAVDRCGVLMRRDAPLAHKDSIQVEDLWDQPLIISRLLEHGDRLPAMMHCTADRLQVVATYSLIFNAAIMVDEGIGYAICLDRTVNTTGNSNLCFRPFYPDMLEEMHIIWKKYPVFTKAAERFVCKIQELAERP